MTLEERIRHAYLSEYLAARRLRREARVARARAEDPTLSRFSHDLARTTANWQSAMAGGTIDVCVRMRHVLRDGGR